DISGGQISAETDAGGTADRNASIKLNGLTALTVTDGLISSSTSSGVAGDVIVNASQSTTLTGQFTDPEDGSITEGGIKAEATGGGDAGSVTVTSDTLTVKEGAAIAVSSQGVPVPDRGFAGDIEVNATTVDISGGQISAETDAGGTAERSASINLNGLTTLTVTNGLISSSTTRGFAGDITIDAAQSIDLTGILADIDNDGEIDGGIIAKASDGGSAGNITLTTPILRASDRAQITASSADPDGVSTGTAGTILLTVPVIELENSLVSTSNEEAPLSPDSNNDGIDDFGSIVFQNLETLTVTNTLVSSSTESGFAGSVLINPAGALAQSIVLDGVADENGDGIYDRATERGGIVATATQGGTAGNIQVRVTDLDILNGAAIAVSSKGVPVPDRGFAGDIEVNATTVDISGG
ncbi:MAG: hypothetical protein ACO3EZ_19570, partial [Prochlorotrichaceae cyanobacterium]